MKKLLLIATLIGAATSAFGQGQIAFNNLGSTNFRLWTNNFSRTASNLMNNTIPMYRIGFYAGNDAGSLSLAGYTTNVAPFGPGFFQGGSPYSLGGFAAGVPIVFQLRAWSLNGGFSYEEALVASLVDPFNVAIGYSAIGTVTPAAASSPPAAIFGTTPGLLQRGFEITGTPEPSSLTLGLLGLGAIALFRKRSKKG